MRLIDGHAHVLPCGLAGTRDARTGSEFLPGGLVRKYDGENAQIMPAAIADTAFPPERLLRLLDACGVEAAVLLANSLTDLRENLRAVKTYPGRFRAAMTVSPGHAGAEELKQWAGQGLSVIKYELSEGLGYRNPGWFPDFRLDGDGMAELYETAGKLGVTVTVDPGPADGAAYPVRALESVTGAFPETRFVICHLGFPVLRAEPGSTAQEQWKRMKSLAKRQNVWFDCAALTDFCRSEGGPFPTAGRLVRDFLDEFGPEKLIWGSDAPGSLCAAGYGQMLALYRDSGLFSESEKERLLGGNAAEAYRIA